MTYRDAMHLKKTTIKTGTVSSSNGLSRAGQTRSLSGLGGSDSQPDWTWRVRLSASLAWAGKPDWSGSSFRLTTSTRLAWAGNTFNLTRLVGQTPDQANLDWSDSKSGWYWFWLVFFNLGHGTYGVGG